MKKLTQNSILIILFITIPLFSSAQNDTLKYIFIGHCYQPETDGSKVDYRLETMDFSDYDGIWLGGDCCSEATLEYSTLEYMNDIFNLSKPLNFWALGNHDTRNGNIEWIKEFTKRETFFANNSNGITEIVLNTNLLPNNCWLIDQQYQMIKNVCDTIENSSHLIMLMHHGIWNNVPGLPANPAIYAHSSLPFWNSNCNDVNSNFVNSVYPMLVNVQNKGIQVICIMGDIGATAKKLNYISDDGINFLGCGLYHNSPDDYVLIFEHIPAENKLLWNYELLNNLIK